MGKERVIELVAERDEISYDEAEVKVDETIDCIIDTIYENNYEEAEDILMYQLGLEPDFLMDLLGY